VTSDSEQPDVAVENLSSQLSSVSVKPEPAFDELKGHNDNTLSASDIPEPLCLGV